jgi:diaminohydroxyphosphoribosylaminopyrimidine deaminase/5-amino-6-(5-phosphoribosylamino)uracil reductase
MTEKEDIKFMRRCLELAIKAEGMTYPNPMVGSVIVHEGKIVGEGYHLRSGEAHAEVNAINSVSDKTVLKRSTLYVNLEPCSHFGKTPPCADFIISNHIPRIVIGTTDTSGKVSGKGIKKLQDSGCEVTTGILDAECRSINRRFFTFHEKRRPYITLKWAQSADGYLDIKRTEYHKTGPTWISGKPERVLVHKWRAAEQAILVGAATIRADDPLLNVREWKGTNPLKLILSSSGYFSSKLTDNTSDSKIIVFTHNPEARVPGATMVVLQKNKTSSIQICEYLYSLNIQSLFIEGGAEVLNHFISTGLWDEARIFTGSDLFIEGVKSPLISGVLYSGTVFSGSSLEIYLKNIG